MKKKIRRIVVDGHKFVWRILDRDENSVLLRIWIKGQKRIPWLDVIYPHREPWGSFAASDDIELSFEKITPFKISTVLKSALQIFEITDEVTSTFKVSWNLKNMQFNHTARRLE